MKKYLVSLACMLMGVAAFAQAPPPAGQPKMLPPDQRFKQLDTNSDGIVSFEEYKIGRAEELKNPPPQVAAAQAGRPVMSIEESFKTIDTNGDGSISKEEFIKRFSGMFPGGNAPGAPSK